MKKIFASLLGLGIAVFFYFQLQRQEKETADLNEIKLTKTEFDESKSNSDVNTLPTKEETLSPQESNRVILEKKEANHPKGIEEPNSNQIQNPMKKLVSILPDALIAEGFPKALGACILDASEENRQSEHPLSFDSLADKCSDLHGISGDHKQSVRNIFRESIKKSAFIIDLDKWHKCASAKKLEGPTCLNEHFQSVVTDFYSENRGNSQLSGSEFSESWRRAVDSSIEKLIENCPQLPPSLTEVYANECNP